MCTAESAVASRAGGDGATRSGRMLVPAGAVLPVVSPSSCDERTMKAGEAADRAGSVATAIRQPGTAQVTNGRRSNDTTTIVHTRCRRAAEARGRSQSCEINVPTAMSSVAFASTTTSGIVGDSKKEAIPLISSSPRRRPRPGVPTTAGTPSWTLARQKG